MDVHVESQGIIGYMMRTKQRQIVGSATIRRNLITMMRRCTILQKQKHLLYLMMKERYYLGSISFIELLSTYLNQLNIYNA